MPRRARLAIPSIAWHTIQRGNNKAPCFYAEEDYHRYLDTLREKAGRCDCAVHAYVLMTNHVHMLLTPTGADSVAPLINTSGSVTCSTSTGVTTEQGPYGRGAFDRA